jgi:CspA family cold shock protein
MRSPDSNDEKQMMDLPPTAVCHQCGRGFIFTDSYRELLAQRNINVKVPVSCVTCFRKRGPVPKEEGTIKWFSARKNYGFIVTDAGRDVFLHRNQILDDADVLPRKGQRVLFHIHNAAKGPEALNAELVES